MGPPVIVPRIIIGAAVVLAFLVARRASRKKLLTA